MPAEPPAQPRAHVRETVETLVFVVVLVLILQLFVLEAFVIPTGSMAETQFGYHKQVTCEECQFRFPVNASEEADGVERVDRYTCPNCQHRGKIADGVGLTPGDRVLVHKAMSADVRGRVVVFKYPVAPQKKQQAQNYIKRCVGFGDETIAVAYGELFVTKALKYEGNPRPDDPRELWQEKYFYPSDATALALFEKSKAEGFKAGGFELYRKPDDLAMEMRRIVYDNDCQPADLIGKMPPRWAGRDGGTGWKADDTNAPKSFAHAGDEIGWVGYRHLSAARQGDAKPQEITNVMGYNCNKGSGAAEQLWCGDLTLECTATVDTGSQLTLELSKGEHRYQAEFANGTVRLVRVGAGNWSPVSRPTPITKAGTYRLRFANVDCRLRVWVNDTAIDFGTEADYAPTADGFAPTNNNDLEAPAGIGAKGAVTVSGLKLYRDTYYTPDYGYNSFPENRIRPSRPATNRDTVETYFVQPGHYLCMGDNSAQSSDGRTWGLVPERLMIGRAVFTFWPAFPSFRIGVIR